MAGVVAAPIVGLVGHNGEEPRPKRCPSPEAIEVSKCFHHRFLHRVLSVIPGNRIPNSERDELMAGQELAIGVTVARSGPIDQLIVGCTHGGYGLHYLAQPREVPGNLGRARPVRSS